LARSIAVNPGDVVNAEVYAKNVDNNSGDWTTALNTLMGQIASHTAGVVVDGTNYNQSGSSFPFPTPLVDKSGSSGGPKAYLNWLIFDRNFVFSTGGYARLSAAPMESGQNVAHELMASPTINITEPGYMYIYISNENDTPVDVYFDDFKVTQVHSNIVAGGDYYPFGLPMETRQITQERYRFGYQGQFAEYDSMTKTNTFQLRRYDARFGRWLTPDPKGQFSSPYIGMGNNPVGGVDKDGGFFEELVDWFANAEGKAAWFDTAEEATAAGFTTRLGDASYIFPAKTLDEVVVTAQRPTFGQTLMYQTELYWNKVGVLKYGQGRYGNGSANNPYRFNFDDKEADCVECVVAPLKDTHPKLYENLTERANWAGDRNANVDVMLRGAKKMGLTPEIRTPLEGDLAFWERHVADVYKVHGDKLAIFMASGKGGTPTIYGLGALGEPTMIVGDNLFNQLGSGKFLGFVTLKP
jgi:RHS repeat-associated protein